MAQSGRALTAEAVERLFGGAVDLCKRELRIAGQNCVLLFIDGLTAGGEIAETVLRPLRALRLQGGSAGSVSAVQTERLSGAGAR